MFCEETSEHNLKLQRPVFKNGSKSTPENFRQAALITTMDKYEVIGTLGEGSFGRVYKARQLSSGSFVALKVISKRGRSNKELRGFRRECEIQRDLHHPNIVQMLDSFETENEIVVITEFAHKELTAVLGKSGYLPEDRVQQIVWDLVSALFYLHSNRVLHRDLKPQNILLDVKNHAKLCDFGFARNMSTGTHVLTSIKGTPLYMAPELIDEQPYDYTADLWSLGCIIYELLMGTPPFCTTSLLHLIRLIRHEQIQWPTFLSDHCISFLKGLLQKNPVKRMTWDEILNHPFVKGHIIMSGSASGSNPLTKPLTPNSLQTKEQQRKESMKNKPGRSSSSKSEISDKSTTPSQKKSTSKSSTKKSDCQDVENNNLTGSNPQIDKKKKDTDTPTDSSNTSVESTSQLSKVKSLGFDKAFNFIEDTQPIETEEWIVFLQKSIQEVISGEMTSLMHSNQTNVLVSPLRNPNASSKVLGYVARLLSLPLIIKGVSEECLSQVKKVYLEVKLIPNIIYAAKLLLRVRCEDTSSSSPSPINSPLPISVENYRNVSEITQEDFQALEYFCLLVTHLVHLSDEFLVQFCDAVVILQVYILVRLLLLLTVHQKEKIVADVLASLTHLLRRLPENGDVIEKILFNESQHADVKRINFVDLLRHSSYVLRERGCYFLMFLGRHLSDDVVKQIWSDTMRETLEALMFDSIESVRIAAEISVLELKNKDYY